MGLGFSFMIVCFVFGFVMDVFWAHLVLALWAMGV